MTIAHVQDVTVDTTGTSAEIEITSTAGNLLVLYVSAYAGETVPAIDSVTDSAGNDWEVVAGKGEYWTSGGYSGLAAAAYCPGAAAVTHVTVTLSESCSPLYAGVSEFSGVAAGAGLDGSGAVSVLAAADDYTTPAITTAAAADVVVAVLAYDLGFTAVEKSAGSATYTLLSMGDVSSGDGAAWGITDSAGSQSAEFTGTISQEVLAALIFAVGSTSSTVSGAAALAGSGTLNAGGKIAAGGTATLAGSGTLTAGAALGIAASAALTGTGSLVAGASNPAMAALIDDFAADDLATLWAGSSTGVTIAGGQAQIPCTSAYPGLWSTNVYDLTGSYAFAQVIPSQGSDRQSFLELNADTDDYATVTYSGGEIYGQIMQAGVSTEGTSVTYDPTEHAWWRIREDAGTLYFETAPDGETWTELWSSAYSFPVSALHAAVISGYYSTDTPTTTYVGAFNIVGTAGDVALAGSGTLTAGAEVTVPGAASLEGSGTLTAGAALGIPGAAALTGAATLTAAAGLVPGQESLTGTGTLTAAGSVAIAGAAAEGSGTLTAGAALGIPGAAALTGAATLTAAAGLVPGQESLTGTGTLTAAGSVAIAGAAALSGAGTPTAGAVQSIPGQAGVAGSGTLTAGSTQTAHGAAALAGSGTLNAGGGVLVPGAATLAGSGSLTAGAAVVVPGATELTGTGYLAAGAQVERLATVALAGTGTLTAGATVRAPGAAALTGTGTLTAGAGMPFAGDAALTGTDTLTAGGSQFFPASAALEGTGTIYTGPEIVPALFPPPTVPVFPAGYQPRQSDFTGWWYDNLGFFQNRPVFRGRQANSTTSVPASGDAAVIGIDTVDEDPYNGWDASTLAWTPPAGYSGWYQVTVTAWLQSDGVANLAVRACIAGTYSFNLATVVAPTTQAAGACGTFCVYLIGGQDTVQAAIEYLNSGESGNTSDTEGQLSALEILWLSD